jgi:hypothetical protein
LIIDLIHHCAFSDEDIRWQIIWQDSLLSITFDRISPTSIVSHHNHTAAASKLSYIDVMRRLSKLGLDIVQYRSVSQTTELQLLQIVQCRDWINEDVQQLEPHLRDLSKCRLIREQLEFWNLLLHRSYILSELCRPAIRNQRQGKEQHKVLTQSIFTLCIDSLANTVEAFLGLQEITKFAMQSWAAVHRSLSSALLLLILGKPNKSERIRRLVANLTTVMSEVLSTIEAAEIPAPLTRSVEALQRLNSISNGTYQEQTIPELTTSDNNSNNNNSLFGHSSFDSLYESNSSSPQTFYFENQETSPYSVLNSIIWGNVDADFPKAGDSGGASDYFSRSAAFEGQP